MRVRCACGWETTGDEDAVVTATQEHGRRLHNMEATREQVVAMAKAVAEAEPPAAPGGVT
jgi:predicted small metal-binding protein